jgi:hypothetical protein
VIGVTTFPTDAYWRRAEVLSIHDGDTITVRLDLGFNTFTEHPLRVFGVNAPELKVPDGSGAKALAYTTQWFVQHRPHGQLMARFMSWDAYNPRFDGILVCGQAHCLNDDLLTSSNAIPMKA